MRQRLLSGSENVQYRSDTPHHTMAFVSPSRMITWRRTDVVGANYLSARMSGQNLQLRGSPTEVWGIATKTDPDFRIRCFLAGDATFYPIKKRTLVRIFVSNNFKNALNTGGPWPRFPTLYLTGINLSNVGSISFGVVTVVECTAIYDNVC